MTLRQYTHFNGGGDKCLPRLRQRATSLQHFGASGLRPFILGTTFGWPSIRKIEQCVIGTVNRFLESSTNHHMNRNVPQGESLKVFFLQLHHQPPSAVLSAAILLRLAKRAIKKIKCGAALVTKLEGSI